MVKDVTNKHRFSSRNLRANRFILLLTISTTARHISSSPSYADSFVIGQSCNGLTYWKTKDGRTLKSLEEEKAIGEICKKHIHLIS